MDGAPHYLMVKVRSGSLDRCRSIERIFERLQDIRSEVEVLPVTSFGWTGTDPLISETIHYSGGA